jgi:4-hydroxythreonine-4-phosphate dehydrogenase
MGDPAGVGPEIILKTICSPEAREAARMLVVGFPEPFRRDAALLNSHLIIREIDSPALYRDEPDTLNLLVPGSLADIPLEYGEIDSECGKAAAFAIEESAKLALEGSVDAVVTAPINKEALNAAGYNFPGHTEFYKHLTGAPDIGMLLTLGDFRVIHVTTHVAIRDVPGLVKKDRIVRVASMMDDALRQLGISKPRIAVCALNPHAGEGGLFGREEIDELAPAAETLRAQGRNVSGPYPPDTVFARMYGGEFDGVVAMFHDQGHIALKLLGFKIAGEQREVGGVNSTLGLPIIRTSVDHGTAFDIAGKGIASPRSMIDAVLLAARFVAGRKRKE